MFDVLQGGGERVDEPVRELGQETDGIHVQDRHVIGQLACVDRDIQGGKELVFGLKTTVTGQGFNQSRFSCTDKKIKTVNPAPSCQTLPPPHSPQLVYPNTETMGNSFCLR